MTKLSQFSKSQRSNLFFNAISSYSFRVPNDIDKNECTKKHKSEAFIPRFVIACVEEIERRGLLVVGLYRLCGSNDNIKALKSEFDESKKYSIYFYFFKSLFNNEYAILMTVP